ncbi:MAG: hypothetical protein AAGI53_17835 [Planctomycetota bacterium]
MNTRKSRLACLSSAFAMACVGCNTLYLDRTLGHAGYGDIARPHAPIPVNVEASTYVLGLKQRAHTGRVARAVLDVLEPTGVFREAMPHEANDAPTLTVSFRNETPGQDTARAFARNYLTFYSFGFIGTHLQQELAADIELTWPNGFKFDQRYDHRMHVCIGRHRPPAGCVKIDEGDQDEALEDVVLSFVRDFQSTPIAQQQLHGMPGQTASHVARKAGATHVGAGNNQSPKLLSR